ncbi:MAG: ferrous iron transport protein B [Calditrichaeota bacterium]|nr:MAG: ferrous iron transport protein B [Calditrichota bacterium]
MEKLAERENVRRLAEKKHHSDKSKKIVLVGSPNVGKSVIFGYLTGQYVTVSNYPGTTVDVFHGKVQHEGQSVEIIDTPGANSLIPNSEDERVTRDIILSGEDKAILQVGDGKNLFRTLYLTLQIMESSYPVVLNLNMMDEVKSAGIEIDLPKLESILGIPINTSIAVRKVGMDGLLEKVLYAPSTKSIVQYPEVIENAIRDIQKLLPDNIQSSRFVAIMLLSGDETLKTLLSRWLSPEQIVKIGEVVNRVSATLGEDAENVISRTLIEKVQEILSLVYRKKDKSFNGISEFLGHYSVHPFWGVPILLLVLYGMYEIVGVFGAGTLVDFMESVVFGEYINPAATWLVNQLIPFTIVREFLVGEYGMITMALSYGFAIVLPIVATFFLMFSLLEDSGYLPRLAVMMNRVFRFMGLNGKAVLPMVLGLGCDTMATLTTRILQTRKERLIVTLLLALGVPCSAQLGVLLALTSVMPLAGSLIWLGVVLGILFLVGYLSSKIMPGERGDFIIELPPFRRPSLMNILYKTIARIEWYLKEVIPLFVLGTTILFLFDKLDILSAIRYGASPIIKGWLGLPEKATDAFLIGFLRRDYGAAGIFALSKEGLLSNNQILVSMVAITLFIPCIANLLMIIKEQGVKVAIRMSAFILPFALLVSGLLNWVLIILGIQL